MTTVSIIGGSGYGGGELIRLLLGHPNVEIKQVADPIYANARGAAWIAAAGLGEIKFADIPELIQFRRAYQPKVENRAVYDRGFENFQLIYKQMKGVYRRLNQ